MSKILIMHASLGTGHASAAKAIGKALEQLGHTEFQVVDALDFANSLFGKTLDKSYLQMSEKAPSLWRMLFEGSDAESVEDSIKTNMFYAKVSGPFMRKMKKFILDYQPDSIICTMQLPAMVVARLKEEGELANIPFYMVVTDFIAHSTWFNHGVTRYFLPGEITRYQFQIANIPDEQMLVTGIPVNLHINEVKEAQAMRLKHNLPTDKPLITLFGGGIVAERVRVMLSLLLDGKKAATVAVVAGRNQKLIDSIEDMKDGPKIQLLKYGLIDFVDDLVAASDLVISKAGGLITSEILGRGTPMVVIDPIPGQEEWNADVVSGSGAGVQLRMPEMAAATALYLLENPARLTDMRAQARLVGRPRSSLDVAENVLQDLGRVI